MGKSFNNDVFNSDFNVDSINGLNISKEAIEENKQATTPKIDLSNINLDEVKKQLKKEKAKQDPQAELEALMQEQERLKEKQKEYETLENYTKPPTENNEEKIPYTKKTMIFKQEYLDIINGISAITNTEIKGVLNKILELGINEMKKQDNSLVEKALKNSKKQRQEKAKDLII